MLNVDEQLPDRLTRLRAQAEAAAAGYRLLSWPGATPAERLGQVARLTGAMADAPRSDSLEAEHWDAARVRETEDRCLARGLRLYAVAACHLATGELAALTQVVQDPAMPGWALQGLTAVLREHRARRLGLLVKVAMQQWLAEQEPDVRYVLTENAEANEHMVAINEQLGFAISARFRQWELELGEPGSPQS